MFPFSVKGHMRKGAVLEALKEYSKAVDAYQKALDIDPNHPDAATACERCLVVRKKFILFIVSRSYLNTLDYSSGRHMPSAPLIYCFQN